MRENLVGVATAALLLLPMSEAAATQTYAAEDINGRYAVECTDAAFVLRWQLYGADAEAGGETPTEGELRLPFLCEGPNQTEDNAEDVAELLAAVNEICRRTGAQEEACADFTAGVEQALIALTGLVPYEVDLQVERTSPFMNDLLGLYLTNVTYYRELDSIDSVLFYNNNDGVNYGRIGNHLPLPLPIWILPFCATTLTGTIDGQWHRNEQPALTSGFDIDLSSWCPFGWSDSGTLQVLRLSGAFVGSVVGSRIEADDSADGCSESR